MTLRSSGRLPPDGNYRPRTDFTKSIEALVLMRDVALRINLIRSSPLFSTLGGTRRTFLPGFVVVGGL